MAYLLLTGMVWIVDRLLKIWVLKALPPWTSKPLLGKWLYLTHVQNTGAAFGLLGGRPLLLAILSIVLLLGIFLWRDKLPALGVPGAIGLALIFGGALGNLFDRLVYGYVVDFLDLRVWPVFNFADSAVVVGAALLIFTLWRQEQLG